MGRGRMFECDVSFYVSHGIFFLLSLHTRTVVINQPRHDMMKLDVGGIQRNDDVKRFLSKIEPV